MPSADKRIDELDTLDSLTGSEYIVLEDSSTHGYYKTTLDAILAGEQDTLTLTTTGSAGPATFDGNVLNIPQYTGAANLTNNSLIMIDADGQTWLFTVNADGSWQSTPYSTTDPIGPVLNEDGIHYIANEDGIHYMAQES